MLPNLFIAGAQKSGTTSLHKFLESHPDVFFPKRPQEIHFFDIDENYVKGLGWFASYFSARDGEKVVGQTSPLYIYEPKVPARIQTVLPAAKFIFILRNPIERAYSHYWHEIRHGYENLSFEDALDREKDRISQGFEARRHYSYVDRGRYVRQILRFLEFFPKQNILVLLYDDLRENSATIAAHCAEFLRVDAREFVYFQSKPKVYNSARLPRVRRLQSLTRHLRQPPFDKFVRHIFDRLNLREMRYPPMDEATQRRLQQEFHKEIIALQDLTNVDVQSWFKEFK